MISPYLQFQQIPQQDAWKLIPALYQQGIRNIKLAIRPQDYLTAFEAATITLVERVQHIVVGILLCLPIINLVTYVALRHFARKLLEGNELEIFDDVEEIEDPKEIQAVEQGPQQPVNILKRNMQMIIGELADAKVRRNAWCISNFTLYKFELQINAQGEIYELTDTSFTADAKINPHVEHQKLYKIELIFSAFANSAPGKAFRFKLQTQNATSLPPDSIRMIQDLNTQLNHFPVQVMEKLAHLTTQDEKADWLAKHIDGGQNRTGWHSNLNISPLWNIILHNWKQLQHVFVEQEKEVEPEDDLDNPEEVEAAVAIQQAEIEEIEAPEVVQQVEEVEEQKQRASILEQNVQALFQEFKDAKARRAMYTPGGPGGYMYGFELQLNDKGEIYTIKDDSFEEDMKVRNVDHETLYQIDFKTRFSKDVALENVFQHTILLQANQESSPIITQMAQDIVVQLKDAAEKVRRKFALMTTDEQAEWLAKNLHERYGEEIWRFILRSEPAWNIVLHHWQDLQPLFV